MTLNLRDTSIFPATPAQVQASRRAHHAHWGRGLSLERFLKRVDLMDVHEHASDGRLMTWVLTPRNNPQTLDFLSSCDTFRRQALVNEPASPEPRQTFAYGVASVFCPPYHRKQGYTKHMLRLLHYVLASPGLLPPFPPEWGAPPVPPTGTGNGCFSALWSDIGSTYYEVCGPTLDHLGWKVKDPIATVWKINSTAKASCDVRWLSEDDCAEVWRHDTHYIREQLAGYQSPNESFIRCTFLPDNGVAAFQIRRTKFFLPGLPSVPIPEKWGVILPGVSQPTYATWTTDIRPLPVALLITRIRASAETLPMLLSAVMVAATENGASTVEVWNLEQRLLETAHELGGLTAQRDEHLSALAWYGSGNIDDVHWLFNQNNSNAFLPRPMLVQYNGTALERLGNCWHS